MIEVSGITKWYPTQFGRKYVLRNVSFVIPDKCNVGIIGPNGAGKSTLLRILGGIDHADEGSVHSTGTISWPMGLAGGWQGSMTGRENARFVGRLYGLSQDRLRDLEDFVQDFSELGRDFELPIKTLSSGMRSRLAFAVSMAFDFDTYIIDELTAVGDRRFRRKSAHALKAKRNRANFIKTSHDLGELLNEIDLAILVYQTQAQVFTNPHQAVDAYRKISNE